MHAQTVDILILLPHFIVVRLESHQLSSLSTGQAMTEKALSRTKRHFSNLLVKVRSSMEANNSKVKNVRDFLVTYFEGECNIPDVGNLSKIFESVTSAKLWRYDHYSPLEELAESFLPDDDPARALMTAYVTQLSAFYATTIGSSTSSRSPRMMILKKMTNPSPPKSTTESTVN